MFTVGELIAGVFWGSLTMLPGAMRISMEETPVNLDLSSPLEQVV